MEAVLEDIKRVKGETAAAVKVVKECKDALPPPDAPVGVRHEELLQNLAAARLTETQLRDELKQLRNKEELLLQHSAGQKDSFKKLLLACPAKYKVADNMVERIQRGYASEAMFAVQQQDEKMAEDIYLRAKNDPGTATRGIILEGKKIAVNGPLGGGFRNLLSAMRCDTGEPMVIKVLLNDTPQQRASSKSEKMVLGVEDLVPSTNDNEDCIPLLAETLLSIKLDHTSDIGHGMFEALLMKRLQLTLSQVPSGMSLTWAARAGLDIMRALSHMHSKGVCHMDVKGDNLFIDSHGRCFLGDFGAAVETGGNIHAMTPLWYPVKLCAEQQQHPADPKIDFGLLASTFAAFSLRNALKKGEATYSELWESDADVHVHGDKVVKVLREAKSSACKLEQRQQEERDFRDFVKQLLPKCDQVLFPCTEDA